MSTPDLDLVIGAIVWNQQDELLLLEKDVYPWGFTPPTQTIERDEDPQQAMRKLLKELNIRTHNLKIIADDREDASEHPFDNTFYQWVVFEGMFAGSYQGVSEEEPRATWANYERLQQLAERTSLYQEDQMSEETWEQQPGLDPAWHDWLVHLEVIQSTPLAMDEFDETDELNRTRADQEPPLHPPET